MRQEGPNVDVSFRPFLICCLCIVHDRDEPKAVSPDVEDDISIDVVGIPKHEPNFRKIVPSDAFDYHDPRLDLITPAWPRSDACASQCALADETSQYVK
jgi:hypothetical protein